MLTPFVHDRVPQSRRDDDWLAARVGRVQPEPFEVLAARWQPAIHAYCLRRLRSHEEADDVVQEVMERMYRTLLRANSQGPVAPLMFAVARNACIDRFRASSRSREACLDEDIPDLACSVPDWLDRKDQFAATIRDLKVLSEHQRQALVLRELDALSLDAIGQRLGVTACGARHLIFGARRILSERRAGRELGCAEFAVLAATLRRPESNHRIQAHAEGCSHCQLVPARPPRATGPVPSRFELGHASRTVGRLPIQDRLVTGRFTESEPGVTEAQVPSWRR